jgi:hypothetical protein
MCDLLSLNRTSLSYLGILSSNLVSEIGCPHIEVFRDFPRVFHANSTSKTKLRGLSPQVNYTDRATAAVGEVVPTFAGKGCYVVSATDSHGR